MASELFITELECLTHFNSHITFVNCVEQFSQGFVILPKLCSDLHKSKKSIWKNLRWTIYWYCKRNKAICISAANTIKLQCGWEYGFSNNLKSVTDISMLTTIERAGPPSNNW